MFNFFRKKNKVKPPKAKPAELSDSEILQALNNLQKELDHLKLAVSSGRLEVRTDRESARARATAELESRENRIIKNEKEKIVEGVFDGQNMIGADGAQYDVPANYASKSKLVEGDILKLTINNLGAFVYKQIKPIERRRMVGELDQDPQNQQFFAVAEGKKWKLLTASVTYFKGEPGDEVYFLIPEDGGSRWAAVENIVKQ
jgi:hypothetical protein